MRTSRPGHARTREIADHAALLGLLVLVAMSLALMAFVAPDVTLEPAATPEFVFSPPSPHLHP